MKMIRLLATCSIALISGSSLTGAEVNRYVSRFQENLPYGVYAWHLSDRVKNGEGRESRFGPYDQKVSKELSNDALIDRGSGDAVQADARETSFYQAYDDKGWYIYIESKEPLVRELLKKLVDPRSDGNKESYELFFSPGKENVPYYQIYIKPYQNKATFFDWGMPSSAYRSLKEDTHIESLPFKDGVGTFVFIPWHLLYDRVPDAGQDWRFSLIRWMPYSKAGGMTWGGQVHETGRFGIVHFQAPAAGQRAMMTRNLLDYAWNKFQATSSRLEEYWSDPHIGDPEFFAVAVKPEMKRLIALNKEIAESDRLDLEELRKRRTGLSELMEFEYRVAALRADFLRKKRLAANTVD